MIAFAEPDPGTWIVLTGMTVNADTGLVRWDTPGVAPGLYPVELRADDGRGGADAQRFTVQVVAAPTNQAPVITSAAPPPLA